MSRWRLSAHPLRAHIHEPQTLGEKAADKVASGMGSWRFIGIQTLVILVWISLNVLGLIQHWDPYPFILLNLLFSTQAAYAAPILQLSGNRMAQKDRMRDDTEAEEVKAIWNLNKRQEELLKQNTELTQNVADLMKQNTELTQLIHDHITSTT